ncbi:MAG: thiamine-phosphate kinase [Deltaproteobacteria bacterium]|nr:MAG: thiamine-phosphate kinase [Deltaproteobacteria bacterium]
MKFSEIGEFGFIESIKKECVTSLKGVIKGIGDDCAVFGPYSGRLLLFTTDMLVEDIHFVRDTITPYQLGWKAIAVNLSDIAAMGGKPLFILISLAIPVEMDVELIQDFYKGMKDICRHYKVDIVGGDTVASPDTLTINVSLIGEVKENEILYRSGARPGDKIFLTGAVGDSSAGLKILKNEISPPDSIGGHFIKAHNEPKPLIETGRIIATSRLASAMIDLSDGLLSDLGHICKESGVGAILFRSKIPLSSQLKSLASIANFNPLDLALSGGEDYVLLLTVPEAKIQDLDLLSKDKRPSPLYLIGEIREQGGIRMVNDDGSVEEIGPRGFNHFLS